ncbi:MAG: hypothetical protein KTR32_42705 [Granulosicoccus sp.]|nr:hypothetical protein [Granulosicoccus sp.]
MKPSTISHILPLILAIVIALTWQFTAVFRIFQNRQTDSFATLTPLGAIGLTLLMLGMVGLLVIINTGLVQLIRRTFSTSIIKAPLGLATALLTFVFFWGVSPQIFYLYYQLLFDGLPIQWVIRDGFPIYRALLLMAPDNISNSSDLAAGVTLVFILVYNLIAVLGPIQPHRR